jgi:sugar phosphate permease
MVEGVRASAPAAPTHKGILCAVGFLMMGFADGLPLLIGGAVVNCVGTGMLLPTLVTRAMARLDFADRGRGMGLWTAAFFFGEFLCPLVLLAGQGAAGSLSLAVALLGAATAVMAGALLAAARRPAPAASPGTEQGSPA